jgi:hypothetical protein
MYDHTPLDWLVPSDEWDRFCRFVEGEDGSLDGYLGDAAEQAMAEYAHVDEYAGIEERVDKLVTAAGRRPEDGFKEKNSGLLEDWADADKTRVTVKVEREVKAKFREVASDSDHAFGVEFARAIRTYRDGGRRDRVERKLDRILDDAERLLSDLQPDDEETEGSSESLSLAERKTIAVCDELGEQFTDDELVDAIERVAEVSSEPSIEKYRGLVVDRLGMERHPGEPHLWVPHDVVDQLAPGQPRVIRQSVERLDREERVRRVQLAVGRAAAERDSDIVRVQTPVIQEEVLGGEVTRSSTLSLMRAAQLSAGIEVDDDSSPAALVVDVQMIEEVDSELAATILRYHDKAEEGLLGSPTSTTVDDYIETPGGNKVHPKNKSAYSDGGSYRNGSLSHMPGFGGDDEEDDPDD